jgi:hypothetical protein
LLLALADKQRESTQVLNPQKKILLDFATFVPQSNQRQTLLLVFTAVAQS